MVELNLTRPAIFTMNPQGPYSSTLICRRMLMIPGSLFEYDHFAWLIIGGMMISGTLGGTALLLVWLALKWAIRAGRKHDTPAEPSP